LDILFGNIGSQTRRLYFLIYKLEMFRFISPFPAAAILN